MIIVRPCTQGEGKRLLANMCDCCPFDYELELICKAHDDELQRVINLGYTEKEADDLMHSGNNVSM